MAESPSSGIAKWRIGTRGSALALTQARMVAKLLQEKFPELVNTLEIVPIRASGDHDPAEKKEIPLYHQGGKGLFTAELEAALHENRIDVAVHSLKDVPAFIPDEFEIAAVLPREDPRDVFLSPVADSPDALPKGAVIGTTSPRRIAQVRHHWPHLKTTTFRGNVDTRLRKLKEGQVQGTFLAYAGLKRLGLQNEMRCFMDTQKMLPCVGQGIIGIEIRKADSARAEMLAALNHGETFSIVTVERAMLRVLNGSCETPIAGLARLEGGQLILDGLVAHPEGKGLWQVQEKGPVSQAIALGEEAGKRLRAQVPPGILP